MDHRLFRCLGMTVLTQNSLHIIGGEWRRFFVPKMEKMTVLNRVIMIRIKNELASFSILWEGYPGARLIILGTKKDQEPGAVLVTDAGSWSFKNGIIP